MASTTNDDPPTKDDLPGMWKRRCAWYVKKDTVGLDLLIVIKKKECGNIGTLRVRVKNLSSKIAAGERQKILQKLLPKICPPLVPCEKLSVGLLLCTGNVEPCCFHSQYNDGNQYTEKRVRPPDTEQDLLQLAAGFPSNNQEESLNELARTLEEISVRHREEEDFTSKRLGKYRIAAEQLQLNCCQ